MRTEALHVRPDIRRLWQSDKFNLIDFFSRTDLQTRQLRFFSEVNDDYVTSYAEGLVSSDTVAYGAFADQALCGISEMRILPDSSPRSAEIALLVEPAWQERGIGDALFDRVLTAAQNRSIRTIYMLCLKENKRMLHLAKKYDAVLHLDTGAVEAELTPPGPTPMSLFYEMFTETRGYLHLMFR
ncbi:GNAT family N-acetyltransferase [Roseovarius sp. CAU 1744]|uniref:GNAT family N-acetyltransferase n=1 Tax=Roseovarius sp. CAU 1744 TaxID=3140368 RepID=UPI00325AFD82